MKFVQPTLFNKLALAAERYLGDFPELQRRVSQAALFSFPGRAHKDLPRDLLYSDEFFGYVSDQFYLPFPTVAIEDTATVVVLWDLERDAVGFGHRRGFIECTSFAEKYQREMAQRPTLPPKPGDESRVSIVWGTIDSVAYDADRPSRQIPDKTIRIGFEGGTLGLKGKELDYLSAIHPEMGDEWPLFYDLLLETGKNALCGMEEIAFSNLPSRFIVEERPTKVQKGKGRIPRVHQRPIFRMLEPAAIRQLLQLPEGQQGQAGQGAKVASHWRRKHPRTYRAKRFEASGLRGKTVFIDAVWVGASKVSVGKRVYQVRLDI